MSNPRIFISYSHDSPEHSNRVLQFSNALRSHGIDAELDRYHVRPPKGWPYWCEEQLRPENAAFVVMICTDTYLKRIQDKVPADEGRGVFWEGSIIYDYLYDGKGNTRFIPVLFADGNPKLIPVPIRNHTRYRVATFDFTDDGYHDLYRELTGQPRVPKPPLGGLINLGKALAASAHPLEPRSVAANFPELDISRILKYAPAELIGRENELKLLNDLWAKVQSQEEGRPHILTFVALGGEGKTSLVAKWAVEEMLAKDWPGCDAAFAWSFYSQGTRDQLAADSDLFLKAALTFFGDEADKQFAASSAGAFEKGQRLAHLVGRRRSLLILDGLEPLQHAATATAFKPGELKDQGVAKLLKDLAAANQGLCIVTTRIGLPDLSAFTGTMVKEVQLERLSRQAGVDLLKRLGVKGSELRNLPLKDGDEKSEKVNEFEKLVEDVKGHALTLTLLGGFLKRAFHGDIRQRDRVKFDKADEKISGGHAFRVLDAYVHWIEQEATEKTGKKSSVSSVPSCSEHRRALAVLRLMGLFDRPADVGCLAALRSAPAIPGLTEPLAGLADDDWEYCLTGLEAAKLLTVNREPAGGALISLDAHPLIREYFAKQLKGSAGVPLSSEASCPPKLQRRRMAKEEPAAVGVPPTASTTQTSSLPGSQLDEASRRDAGLNTRDARSPQTSETWRAGHKLLYEHLCKTTSDKKPNPTLEDLQPLYQAVAHGCQAGLQQEACEKVYRDRILRGTESDGFYSTIKLGAFGSDLGAVACFFEQPWSCVSPALTDAAQAWLLNQAAVRLRALGRLTEAREPMRVSGEMDVKAERLEGAAISYSNLSELELTLGEVAASVGDAEQSVTYADRSGDWFQRMGKRTTHADALHQVGRRAEAETRFREAEQMQTKDQPDYPLLYSLQGIRYCDLLLAAPERAAWQLLLNSKFKIQNSELSESCHSVSHRAAQTIKIAERNNWLLNIALDHLTLGRAALYAAILNKSAIRNPQSEIEQAASGLRRAATVHHLPRALLTRAWLRFLTGARTGPDSAQEDLDEAWEIAKRGPMKLHMADIHLHRARLFGRLKAKGQMLKYPWESPAADLAAARQLITTCGYHRRDEELADAQRALLGH